MNTNDPEYILQKAQISKHFPVLMKNSDGHYVYYIANKFHEEKLSQPLSYAHKFYGSFARVKRVGSDKLEYIDIVGNITEEKTEFGEAIYDFVTEIHRGGICIDAFRTIPEKFLNDENFMTHAINLYAIKYVRVHSHGTRMSLTKKIALSQEAEQIAKDYIDDITNPPIENE